MKKQSKSTRWPQYYYSKGFFYHKVFRRFHSGKRELIAMLPAGYTDSEELTKAIVDAFNDQKDELKEDPYQEAKDAFALWTDLWNEILEEISTKYPCDKEKCNHILHEPKAANGEYVCGECGAELPDPH